MLKKPLTFFLLIFLGLQACSMPATATPTPTPDIGEPPTLVDLFVAMDGNNSNDCLSETTACATVTAAILKMSSPAIIHIGPGDFYTNNIAFGTIYDTTYIGAGRDATTLLSDLTTSVMQVNRPVHISIEGLSIGHAEEGQTDTWGLEVRTAGASVEMHDCHVSDLIHGITVWEGTTLNIDNCLIENNATGIENAGTLSVTNSRLTANAVALQNRGVANISGTTFESNGVFSTASGAGTATINTTAGELTMGETDIINNGVYGMVINGGTVNYTGGQVSNNGNLGIWHVQGDFTGQSLIIADNGGYGINVGGRSSVESVGTFRLRQSAILRNYSAGIRIDDGVAQLQNDTIGENTATSSGGGGIWVYGGNLLLLDSTVAHNNGHGISGSGDGSVITIRRSVVALNTDTECDIDAGIFISYGTPGVYTCNDDMTEATIKLGPLSEIGGTWVYPLQDGSPLIDAGGPAAGCPTVDQRGVSRPIGATCDIGAYEHAMAITAASPAPTEELAQIYTSTPEPLLLTFTLNAFCRKGPGTRYFDIESFNQSEQALVEGRNDSDPRWWWVQIPNSDQHCWVSSATMASDEALETLPVMPAPALPDAPSYFDGAPTCKPKENKRDVKLNWPGVSGATGYRIYRNGNLITTADANIGIYVDTVPYTQGVTYELEAINKYGASEKLTTISSACQ